MKANRRLALAVLVSASLGAALVTGLKAQAKPPVYVVIDISEMLDVDTFGKAIANEKTTTLGGRYIIRTQKATALDGGPPPNRFVVIAFDSEEKVKAWRDSPEMKEVNAARLKTTKSRSFMVEGLAN